MKFPLSRAGTTHMHTSASGIRYNEDKTGWLSGVVSERKLFAHATSVTPDQIRRTHGLDPQYAPFDRVALCSGGYLYEQFIYAFALESEDPPVLCGGHRHSSWAVPGNYVYVFDGARRRYMSSRRGLLNTEVGFSDLIVHTDLTPYVIEAKHKLRKL